MNHFATSEFWFYYRQLPDNIRNLADKNFELLRNNPRHSSLRLKKVGVFWSVRVGLNYRKVQQYLSGVISWCHDLEKHYG